MTAGKGEGFEELVREYFARRGFFAIRSVRFQFEGDDVTDVDVWLYGKQPSGFRLHAIVDAKNKKSPKALERILWVKGMQAVTKSDRVFIATTDKNPKVVSFGERHGVIVLNKPFLEANVEVTDGARLSLEQFNEYLRKFDSIKSDGDWLGTLDRIKSATVSSSPFHAFNIAAAGFRFFGERVSTRPKFEDQARRCAVFSVALACISLDSALERLQFADTGARRRAIRTGIAFGDSGDGQTLKNLNTVLSVIGDHIEGGKAVSARVRSFFDALPDRSRAEIVAEHFAQDGVAQKLFSVSRELERWAFRGPAFANELTIDAKATLGVFADFMKVDRRDFLSLLKSPIANVDTQEPVLEAIAEPKQDDSITPKLL
jgi:hypothetical protein